MKTKLYTKIIRIRQTALGTSVIRICRTDLSVETVAVGRNLPMAVTNARITMRAEQSRLANQAL